MPSAWSWVDEPRPITCGTGKKAEIEALFEISADHPVCGILEEMGLEPEEDLLPIRREISASGKSTCRINGSPVTLSMLKKVGRSLLDIHGQHEHQSLLRTEEHLEWLDAFGDQSLKELRRQYEALYHEYRALEKELERLTSDERETAGASICSATNWRKSPPPIWRKGRIRSWSRSGIAW